MITTENTTGMMNRYLKLTTATPAKHRAKPHVAGFMPESVAAGTDPHHTHRAVIWLLHGRSSIS